MTASGRLASQRRSGPTTVGMVLRRGPEFGPRGWSWEKG
jgi:hypothetical protein